MAIEPNLSPRLKSMTLHVDGVSFAFGGTVADAGDADGKSWAQPRPDLDLRHRRHDPADARQRRPHGGGRRSRNAHEQCLHVHGIRTSGSPTWDAEHGQSLQSVRIITLPASGKGTLTLGGTAVTADQSVARSDIDGGRLKYTPPADEYGDDLASFTFKVSDGTAESSTAYTMTVTVTAPLVSIGPDILVVAEGAGAAVVTVSLDRPRGESALSVLWLTQDGTAEAPNDYTAREGSRDLRRRGEPEGDFGPHCGRRGAGKPGPRHPRILLCLPRSRAGLPPERQLDNHRGNSSTTTETPRRT